jgi:Helix-turn-helix domain
MPGMNHNRILLKIKHHQMRSARGRVPAAAVARDLRLSPQTFASYENGTNRVPAPVLIKWCSILDLQPDDVIAADDRRLLQSLVAAQ